MRDVKVASWSDASKAASPKNQKPLTISDILRTNRVQQLGTHRHTQVREITQQLPSNPKTFVDLERAVDIRVVDEAFPTDCCSGFFTVKDISTNDWEGKKGLTNKLS